VEAAGLEPTAEGRLDPDEQLRDTPWVTERHRSNVPSKSATDSGFADVGKVGGATDSIRRYCAAGQECLVL